MPAKTDEKTEYEIVKLYNDGYGTLELSDKFKIHRATVQKILNRNNIKLRKRTPSHYNIHFFDEYNIYSCYWAGFIAADGCIRSDRNSVSIHLSNIDLQHLEKLKILTSYMGKIQVYDNECCLSFAGKWFQEALANNFDIFPKKTFDIKMSNKIPDNMIIHYLRGYFDGDGCITNVRSYPRISFTSGSIVLLNQISNFIYCAGVRVNNKTGFAKINNNNYISYNCKNAQIILDLLYSNSNDFIRLERKYHLYLQSKNGVINEC